jgi:hypothetical protein
MPCDHWHCGKWQSTLRHLDHHRTTWEEGKLAIHSKDSMRGDYPVRSTCWWADWGRACYYLGFCHQDHTQIHFGIGCPLSLWHNSGFEMPHAITEWRRSVVMVSWAQTRSSLLTLASHEVILAQHDRVVTAWLEAPLEAGNCLVKTSLRIFHQKNCTQPGCLFPLDERYPSVMNIRNRD